MAEEADKESKKGSPLKIIVIVFVVLVLLGAVAGGVMFAMGMFDTQMDAEKAISEMEMEASGGSGSSEKPQLEDEYDPSREPVYHEIKPELLSNIFNSSKVIQVRVAIMFKDNKDGDVAALFQQLNFPIRNALLKVLASQREEMIARINFREDLAFELKKEINDILEIKTGSREVLELYFAELIVQ